MPADLADIALGCLVRLFSEESVDYDEKGIVIGRTVCPSNSYVVALISRSLEYNYLGTGPLKR